MTEEQEGHSFIHSLKNIDGAMDSDTVDYLNEILFISPDPVKVMVHSFNHRFLLSAYYKQTKNKKEEFII